MISTRRRFLTSISGIFGLTSQNNFTGLGTSITSLLSFSPWRTGASATGPRTAHNTTPASAKASTTSTPPWLDHWLRLPRHLILGDHLRQLPPHLADQAYRTSLIAERIRTGKTITFSYHGGSTPGEPRQVIPVSLFTVQPLHPTHQPSNLTQQPFYLLAYCLTRHSTRTFRIDRIQLSPAPQPPP